MKQIIKFATFFLIVVFVFASCKKETTVPIIIPSGFPTIPSSNPFFGDITVIPMQLINLGSLSIPREGVALATAGNKILFAGGNNYDPWYGDINEVYSRVDIYDFLTDTWTVADLSQARMGIAVSTVGNKIFFAGGIRGGDWKPTSRVDIYDAVTNLWSTAELSEARAGIAAVSAGNKILFAGGTDNSGIILSDHVDIYDASLNSWSTTVLPHAGAGIVAGSVGNKILLPGKSYNVDIYDIASNTWSVSYLSEAISVSASVTVNNKVLFVNSFGGSNPVFSSSKHVNIYNAANANWSVDSLDQFDILNPVRSVIFGAATAGNFSVFITRLHFFLIYNGLTNTWAITSDTQYQLKGLSSIISANSQIYIADAGGVWMVQL